MHHKTPPPLSPRVRAGPSQLSPQDVPIGALADRWDLRVGETRPEEGPNNGRSRRDGTRTLRRKEAWKESAAAKFGLSISVVTRADVQSHQGPYGDERHGQVEGERAHSPTKKTLENTKIGKYQGEQREKDNDSSPSSVREEKAEGERKKMTATTTKSKDADGSGGDAEENIMKGGKSSKERSRNRTRSGSSTSEQLKIEVISASDEQASLLNSNPVGEQQVSEPQTASALVLHPQLSSDMQMRVDERTTSRLPGDLEDNNENNEEITRNDGDRKVLDDAELINSLLNLLDLANDDMNYLCQVSDGWLIIRVAIRLCDGLDRSIDGDFVCIEC